MVSKTCVLPSGPVAVQVQADGLSIQTLGTKLSILPLVWVRVSLTLNPKPVEVHTRVTEVAFVLVHFSE